MEKLNISIYLAIRLYGNSSITRPQLALNWKKDINTYSLIDGYNDQGVGDSLPGENPDGEIIYIFSKPSENSYEFDINFPKGHDAKSDNLLDLRFDFIWVVTCVNESSVAKESIPLHIYDFEEDITIQTLTKREISELNYIFGTPDTMIENYILWMLTQNPL